MKNVKVHTLWRVKGEEIENPYNAGSEAFRNVVMDMDKKMNDFIMSLTCEDHKDETKLEVEFIYDVETLNFEKNKDYNITGDVKFSKLCCPKFKDKLIAAINQPKH